MNIAITTLVNPAVNNGLGQYIKQLIKGLQAVETEHHFYIIVNRELDDFIEITHPNFHKILVNIPHHPRPIMRPLFFAWQNILTGQLFKKYKIDVLHLPNPIPLFNTFDVPHVITIHDVAENLQLRHSNIHGQFRSYLNKICSLKASRILTVSNFSKTEIIKVLKVKKSKVIVTHLGMTLNIPNDTEVEGTKMYNKPYLLHVGGSHINKNVERTVNAFLKSNCHQKCDLVIVGGSKYLKYNSSKLVELEKKGVYFKGYVTEVELVNYYKGAVGLIYPSLYEGFGLPLLEAMALGVPVITSNCASMPEVAGDAALFVNPEDEKSIQKAIEKLYDDSILRESLINKGLERVKEFDWKITARKTILAYEAAVHKQ